MSQSWVCKSSAALDAEAWSLMVVNDVVLNDVTLSSHGPVMIRALGETI